MLLSTHITTAGPSARRTAVTALSAALLRGGDIACCNVVCCAVEILRVATLCVALWRYWVLQRCLLPPFMPPLSFQLARSQVAPPSCRAQRAAIACRVSTQEYCEYSGVRGTVSTQEYPGGHLAVELSAQPLDARLDDALDLPRKQNTYWQKPRPREYSQ
jgi:hypothetical protein